MFTFENNEIKHQFQNGRYFYGLFKIIFILLSVAFYHKFGRGLHITCVGRDYNKGSAHCDLDKLVCAIDVRTKDLTLEQIKWLANQDVYLHPYLDVIVKDKRMDGQDRPQGFHCHIELNPGWWVKF